MVKEDEMIHWRPVRLESTVAPGEKEGDLED